MNPMFFDWIWIQFNWILIQLLSWIGFTSVQLKSNQIQYEFKLNAMLHNISIQMECHSIKSIHILHQLISYHIGTI